MKLGGPLEAARRHPDGSIKSCDDAPSGEWIPAAAFTRPALHEALSNGLWEFNGGYLRRIALHDPRRTD